MPYSDKCTLETRRTGITVIVWGESPTVSAVCDCLISAVSTTKEGCLSLLDRKHRERAKEMEKEVIEES